MMTENHRNHCKMHFIHMPTTTSVTVYHHHHYHHFLLYNIYAVQQDTQSVLMSEFYSALMLARHVSDLTCPSSGAFCISCIRRFGMCRAVRTVVPRTKSANAAYTKRS